MVTFEHTVAEQFQKMSWRLHCLLRQQGNRAGEHVLVGCGQLAVHIAVVLQAKGAGSMDVPSGNKNTRWRVLYNIG